MSCVLRASGSEFEVDLFLRDTALKPSKVWRKGERRLPPVPTAPPVNQDSGVNVPISEASLRDLKQQIRDAMAFISEHRAELERLRRFRGVECLVLDFAIAATDDSAAATHRLPAELIRLAGELDLSVDLSVYAAS